MVERARPEPWVLLVRAPGTTDQRVPLAGEVTEIGRGDENHVSLPRGSVEKRHAKLYLRKGRFTITDLKTQKGTFVNGKRAEPTLAVEPGDEIQIGTFRLVVQPAEAARQADESDDPVVRIELNRRADARDWPGVLQLLERLAGREDARGEAADWGLVERLYLCALERTEGAPPEPPLEAALWGALAGVYQDRLGNKRDAHEALKVARRLDPATYGRASMRPPAAAPPRRDDTDVVRVELPYGGGEATEEMEAPPPRWDAESTVPDGGPRGADE